MAVSFIDGKKQEYKKKKTYITYRNSLANGITLTGI